MKAKTRNVELKRRASYASNLLRERKAEAERLIKAKQCYIHFEEKRKIREIRSARRNARMPALRFAALLLISLTLISSLLASFTMSWFMMTIEGPATQLTTGHTNITFTSYKPDLDTAENINRYINSEVTGVSSTTLCNALQTEIGMFADDHVKDDVYFIAEKGSDSISLETYLSFSVEGVNGSGIVSDYIGGVMFQLENITETVLEDYSPIATTVYDVAEDTSFTSSSAYEQKLNDYINHNVDNEALSRPLSFISSDVGTNTATDLVGGDVCIYRLTIYLTEEARSNPLYQDMSFTIRVKLKAAQEGALTGGTSAEYPVASTTDMNDAISKVNPGDIIKLNDSFSYSGDLIFNVPVELRLNGHTLTVLGNLVCTSSYSGEFKIDTSTGGKLLVKKVNSYGGNLKIDAGDCSFLFKGANSVSNVDIAIEGEFTADCSAPSSQSYSSQDTDTGLTIDGARICAITSGSVVQSELKGVTVKDNTRVNVTAGTSFGTITADSGVELFSLVNKGTVSGINLTDMNVIYVSANSIYCTQMHMPQIFIDNFGTISSKILLPYYSWKFSTLLNQGNTRIIREFDATDTGVDGSHYFFDSHIESVAVNVIDVNGNGSYLKVYYTDFTTTNITLQQIFAGNGTDAYPGYFADTGRNASSVVNVKIITGSTKSLTDADYLYLRTNLTSITTLDLSEASTVADTVPSSAFAGMSVLSNLTLPSETVTLGSNIVYGTQVYDLYLPSGVSAVAADTLKGVKYVHPQNTETAIANLITATEERYIFAPTTTMLADYRQLYSTYPSYLFNEATLSNDGNFFYRKESAITIDLAVWVGTAADASTANFSCINADGNDYYIVGIDDYAFYNKLTAGIVNITFSTQLTSIGEYAFEGCTAIKSIYIKSSNLLSIGFEAFKNCTSLTEAYIDGVDGKTATIMDSPADDDTEYNSVFYGCSSLSTLTLSHVSGVSAYILRPDGNSFLPIKKLNIYSTGDIAANALYYTIGNTSYGSTELEELNIENVLNIGNYAFKASTGLKSLYMKGVYVLGASVFADCSNLKIISAPDLYQVGLSVFENCTSLEVVSIPKLNTVNGASTQNSNANTFYNCTNIKILDIGIPSQQYVSGFFAPNTTLNNLKLWIVHTESFSGGDIPDGYINAALPDEALLYVSASMYSNFETEYGTNVISLGTLSAADLNWADATGDYTIVWRVDSADVNSKRLSDFGLGDYLYSTTGTVSTVWRCVIEQVKGTETMPDVAPNGGTTIIADRACQYLDGVTVIKNSDDNPRLIIPESVKRIEQKAFYNSDLYSVTGDGVTFLGISSFENCHSLRVAKFKNCIEFGVGAQYISYNYKYCKDALTFKDCEKLCVIELGIIEYSKYDSATNHTLPFNIVGSFYNCTSLKYIIIHTENAQSEAYLTRNIFVAGFRSPTSYVDMDNWPDYKILLSETSKTLYNFYRDTNWGDVEKNHRFSTGSLMADSYCFASDNNNGVSKITTTDGWNMSDIGYGDYICSKSVLTNEASLALPIFQSNTVISTDFYTPSYTVDNIPITSIAANAYSSISFSSNVDLIIADTTTTIGDYAFKDSDGSGTGNVKNIVSVYLNNVETLGISVFDDVTTIQTVEAGENITNLGTNTFVDCSSSLDSLTLKTNNCVYGTSLFDTTAMASNTDFTSVVSSVAYINYYHYPTVTSWFGISTNTEATNVAHFVTLGDVYAENGFTYYYEAYEDNLTGILGYRILSIEDTSGSAATLSIPSGILDTSDSIVKPVLSIGQNAFSPLSNSTTITSVVLPKYLQTIDSRNFNSLWSAMSSYSISSTYPSATEPVSSTSIVLACNFTVVNDILYSADQTVLLSCPPAIATDVTTSPSNDLVAIGPYAFKNSQSENITINSSNDYVIISGFAFFGSSTTETVTISCGAYIMDNAFYNMSGLTELRLTSVETVSQFFGSSIVAFPNDDFKIYVPQPQYQYYGMAGMLDTKIESYITVSTN